MEDNKRMVGTGPYDGKTEKGFDRFTEDMTAHLAEVAATGQYQVGFATQILFNFTR